MSAGRTPTTAMNTRSVTTLRQAMSAAVYLVILAMGAIVTVSYMSYIPVLIYMHIYKHIYRYIFVYTRTLLMFSKNGLYRGVVIQEGEV